MESVAYRDVCVRAVRCGMEVLRAPAWTAEKRPADHVTDVDREVERRMTALISGHFPGHGVVGEELSSSQGDGRHIWWIDPVDGTTNLVVGRPDVAISVAVAVGGQVVAGAIALPARGLVISAAGEPAELRVEGPDDSARRPRRGTSIASIAAMPGDVRKLGLEPLPALFRELGGRFDALRISGALGYDLAAIALGELAARVSLDVKDVDAAAGAHLVRAAGGLVTNIEGHPYTFGATTLVAGIDRGSHGAALTAARRAVGREA